MLKQFSFSPVPVLITLVVFSILMRLGFWQLERAEEKQRWLTQFSGGEIMTEPEFALAIKSADVEALNGRKVALEGELKPEQVWLIDNQVLHGKVGYGVVVPFRPSSSDRFIWLHLGWISAGKYRTSLPNFLPPERLAFTGVVKSTEFSQFVLQEEELSAGWPKRVQALTAVMESDPDTPSLVVFSDSDSIPGLPQIYKPSVMPPEKHKAYALQWFLLALASLLVFAFASRQKRHTNLNQSGGMNNNES